MGPCICLWLPLSTAATSLKGFQTFKRTLDKTTTFTLGDELHVNCSSNTFEKREMEDSVKRYKKAAGSIVVG